MNAIGLLPCPSCGSDHAVRLQTPIEEDGWVRRAYFRCFGCGLVSGEFPGWKTVPAPEHGKVAWGPLRDFWNEGAAHLRGPAP